MFTIPYRRNIANFYRSHLNDYRFPYKSIRLYIQLVVNNEWRRGAGEWSRDTSITDYNKVGYEPCILREPHACLRKPDTHLPTQNISTQNPI